MDTVLISGGTGLIGKHLTNRLLENGFRVALLSRKAYADGKLISYKWDPENNIIDPAAVTGADYIIHLAGAGIGDKRWTRKRKQIIVDSRVKTSELLFNTVKVTGTRLKGFISASGTGYYGSMSSDRIFRETDPPSADFLGETCRQWENSADRFNELGARVVKIRTGIVLTRHGGIIGRMTTPVRLGLASAFGTGEQFVPWIHIQDLCNIYLRAIADTKMAGAYNAVAPEHKTNSEFIKTLASTLGKPYFFPDIPAFLLRTIFGEMSHIFLEGSRISSEKITTSGFVFQFPDIEIALKNLFCSSEQSQ